MSCSEWICELYLFAAEGMLVIALGWEGGLNRQKKVCGFARVKRIADYPAKRLFRDILRVSDRKKSSASGLGFMIRAFCWENLICKGGIVR